MACDLSPGPVRASSALGLGLNRLVKLITSAYRTGVRPSIYDRPLRAAAEHGLRWTPGAIDEPTDRQRGPLE
jgi:hypothetical protein